MRVGPGGTRSFLLPRGLVIEAPDHQSAPASVGGLDEARLIEDKDPGKRIRSVAAEVLRDLGYRLVRVKLSAAAGATVQIMAERPNGTMSIEDCERASLALSPVFDLEEPMTRAYRLEVSSPGIDRPLVRESDFLRAVGQEAQVEMTIPLNGRKRFRGRIEAVTAGLNGPSTTLSLIVDQGDLTHVELPIRAMAEARLVLTEALIRATLRREKAAVEAMRRQASARQRGEAAAKPGGAPKAKPRETKAAARGAASKPPGRNEGDANGR